jgi:glycosyltransferase involved in cell wall biosynthesis
MSHIAYRRFSAGSAALEVAGTSAVGAAPPNAPELPRVSCLMVTRGRMPWVRAATASFAAQTWPHRELVIVCDAVTDALRALVAATPQVRLEEAPAGLTLGELRNLSLARAHGDFVCQWDDDDLYDPGRIALSMKVLTESGVDAVFLDRWLTWWPARDRLFVSSSRLWEGSVLARRSCMPAYPSQARAEDSVVTQWIARHHAIAVMVDCPWMYCYRVTGENTWDAAHFERHFAEASRVFEGAEAEQIRRLPCFGFAEPGA